MGKHRVHNCPRCGSLLMPPIPTEHMVKLGVDGDKQCPHCKCEIVWQQEWVAHEKDEPTNRWETA